MTPSDQSNRNSTTNVNNKKTAKPKNKTDEQTSNNNNWKKHDIKYSGMTYLKTPTKQSTDYYSTSPEQLPPPRNDNLAPSYETTETNTTAQVTLIHDLTRTPNQDLIHVPTQDPIQDLIHAHTPAQDLFHTHTPAQDLIHAPGLAAAPQHIKTEPPTTTHPLHQITKIDKNKSNLIHPNHHGIFKEEEEINGVFEIKE